MKVLVNLWKEKGIEKMWLIYKHMREIKVVEVRGIPGNNMYAVGCHNKYYTRNPEEFMKLQHGKVLCQRKEDIPKAIEMVKGSSNYKPQKNIYLTNEEIELLEQCLSKYFYDIDGTPDMVISCAEKLREAKK